MLFRSQSCPLLLYSQSKESLFFESVASGDVTNARKFSRLVNRNVICGHIWNREPPLISAARKGDLAMVKMLLQEFPSVRVHREIMERAVYNASLFSHIKVLSVLSPQVLIKNWFFWINSGDVDKVKLYLQGGMEVNTREVDGKTALHQATLQNHVDIVQLLLQNGANPNIVDQWGMNPLLCAVSQSHLEIVQKLLQAGSDIHVKSKNRLSLLTIALQRGCVQIAQLLIQKGIDIHEKDGSGAAPLLYAIGQYLPDIVIELLKRKVDVNTRTRLGSTALILAVQKGYLDLVELLLSCGADINMADRKFKRTPLHWAVRKKDIDIVEVLLKNQADLEKRDAYLATPLVLAVWSNVFSITQMLLNHGANSNIRFAEDRRTPLMVASFNNLERIVELLLASGADVRIKNSAGWSATTAADHQGHSHLAKRLRTFVFSKEFSLAWIGCLKVSNEIPLIPEDQYLQRLQVSGEKLFALFETAPEDLFGMQAKDSIRRPYSKEAVKSALQKILKNIEERAHVISSFSTSQAELQYALYSEILSYLEKIVARLEENCDVETIAFAGFEIAFPQLDGRCLSRLRSELIEIWNVLKGSKCPTPLNIEQRLYKVAVDCLKKAVETLLYVYRLQSPHAYNQLMYLTGFSKISDPLNPWGNSENQRLAEMLRSWISIEDVLEEARKYSPDFWEALKNQTPETFRLLSAFEVEKFEENTYSLLRNRLSFPQMHNRDYVSLFFQEKKYSGILLLSLHSRQYKQFLLANTLEDLRRIFPASAPQEDLLELQSHLHFFRENKMDLLSWSKEHFLEALLLKNEFDKSRKAFAFENKIYGFPEKYRSLKEAVREEPKTSLEMVIRFEKCLESLLRIELCGKEKIVSFFVSSRGASLRATKLSAEMRKKISGLNPEQKTQFTRAETIEDLQEIVFEKELQKELPIILERARFAQMIQQEEGSKMSEEEIKHILLAKRKFDHARSTFAILHNISYSPSEHGSLENAMEDLRRRRYAEFHFNESGEIKDAFLLSQLEQMKILEPA